MFFQVCSHAAYPQHSDERYRTVSLTMQTLTSESYFFNLILNSIMAIQPYLKYK